MKLQDYKVQISEREFQAQIVELAQLCGWRAHFERPARTAHGWRTPIQGDKGFPDGVLAHEGQRRLIICELKSERGKLSKEQRKWLDVLRLCGIEAYVWRPSDWPEVMSVLQPSYQAATRFTPF